MREINKIIIHCSATRLSQDIGAAEIDKWHKQQGWDGIGYHYVIRRNGRIENGRAIEKAGAHCKGHNANSIGICLVGGIDDNGKAENNFTERQFLSLDTLLTKLRGLYPIKTIAGHCRYTNKACPCFDVNEFLNKHNLGIYKV